MDAITTSAGGALAPAKTTMGEWRQFFAFLKRPALPPRAPLPRAATLLATLRMLLLDFAVMAALLSIAGIVMATGVDLPETALAGMEITTVIIVAAVIGAPLLEEIAFRGWLSGRPGHVLACVLLLIGAFGLAQAGASESAAAIAGIGMLAAIVAAVVAIILLRKRDAMGWFQRVFPGFFWLSTLGFSLVHLFNFEPAQMAMALPLVLPQFVTGAILGYVRVHYGLWAAILLHMLHNGLFISLVVMASEAAA